VDEKLYRYLFKLLFSIYDALRAADRAAHLRGGYFKKREPRGGAYRYAISGRRGLLPAFRRKMD